jgi:hypothetical protein
MLSVVSPAPLTINVEVTLAPGWAGGVLHRWTDEAKRFSLKNVSNVLKRVERKLKICWNEKF